MIKILMFIGIIISCFNVHAQSDKKIDKSIKIYKKNAQKGIDKLKKYMNSVDHPNVRAWNVMVDMKYIQMQNQKSLNLDFLEDFFTNYTQKNFFDFCRLSTILSESSLGDYHLRTIGIEVDPDTLLTETAKTNFSIANTYFDNENYVKAITNYNLALKENPNFYNANIKIAISHWRNNENLDSSLFYLNKAKEIQPYYLYPYKLAIEVLIKKGLFYRAKKECVNGLCIYPGQDLKLSYQKILYEENKYYDETRLWRSFYLNNPKDSTQNGLSGEFSAYRVAKITISKYTNKDGIIEANNLTSEVYLEVYSWKQLLKNIKDDHSEYFNFAYQMQEEGYLDCYVLMSLFHYDIYPQFKHFMADEKNRERTKEYIDKYLIKTYPD